MQKLPGAGFSTDGKQSGCRLESGRDMLHTVVKFGSCNELTVDHIHHLKTNLQCKTCVVFEKAVGYTRYTQEILHQFLSCLSHTCRNSTVSFENICLRPT